jgi:hypothetical protein
MVELYKILFYVKTFTGQKKIDVIKLDLLENSS